MRSKIPGVEVDGPIPAFYCCYLLRSKNRKSYYIGSTPNPVRRLRQHNGSNKGGAKRTSMQGKRPWEMTCIVTGFPSKYAALQFEWAWQNPHATRHIERDVKEARVEELPEKKKKKTTKGEGTGRGRRKRPPMNLPARLKNLHFLMGVRSFERWPLNLRFFAADVFAAWEKNTAKMAPSLRDTIGIQLTPAELPAPAADTVAELENQLKIPDVILAIPVAYEDSKAHVEKAKATLSSSATKKCSVCSIRMTLSRALTLICPVDDCRAISHMSCLSTRFLAEENTKESLIPIQGTCPTCKTPLQWATLTKELTLRLRGEKEMEAMFKPKRRKKADRILEPDSAGPQEPDEGDEDEELDETWMEDVDDGDEVEELQWR
ncbi:GIY-YIG-domain-containing protein [Massarina eburnea CBS 473.64]|uniref:GIY-YIG-domain-containing protein n=1 Tax=Massarina eburnea CBS 473.64 TaxID=1395130 RepID=A0A6A6SHT2_9PLEO|nr:GIY-YIG-domain-containing protein [Massarina eburnea CBS 473.64]